MAGHNKWSQIKRKKGVADQKRGQLFSKLSKEITMAAKLSGGDANHNTRLRTAIQTAKIESMPSENIERAIKKGTGEIQDAAIYEELIYEGYAPKGVAIIVQATTDNKNRTAAEIRSIFSKNHGHLGVSGSVAWMFHKKAYFFIESTDEDKILEATIDVGVEDIRTTTEGIEIIGSVENFEKIEAALKAVSISPSHSKLLFLPENTLPIHDEEDARKIIHLIDQLEENDDVQNVYSNFEMSDELMKKSTEN